MINMFVKAIKKIFSLLFETNLLAIFCRLVIIFLISFFLTPILYPNFTGLRVKLELFILSSILLEILASKLKSISVYNNLPEDKTNKTNFFDLVSSGVASKYLAEIFRKQPCLLFLHTQSINIENIVSSNNYTTLSSDPFTGQNSEIVKVFNNHRNTIVSCNLEEFKKIILDPAFLSLKNQLIKSIKINKHPSVTLVVNVEDLISLNESKTDLLKNFYSCMQFLNNHLGSKFNFNLLIDNISKLKGFDEMLEINRDKLAQDFSVLFMVDITDHTLTLRQFNFNFQNFIQGIRDRFFRIRTERTEIYQLIYTFIEQIRFFREPLSKLIEVMVIPTPSKKFFFHRKREILVTINFIDSTGKSQEKKQSKLPVMLREFEQYMQKI